MNWAGVGLVAALVTIGEGLLRAYVRTPYIRNWGPLIGKVGLAWWFSRKAKTRPLAYAVGALAIADLAASATSMIFPAAAAPTPPKEGGGFVALPPGLAGPTGFPTGARYPSYPGLPSRLNNSPYADGYGYMLADAAGISAQHVM